MAPARRIPAWYLGVVLAAGLQRLRELAVSRTHSARHPGRQAAAAGYPVMVVVHGALFVMPLVEVGFRPRRPRPAWPWLALLVGATALRWWSIRSLGEAWNVRAIVAAGLDPVERGPYRHLRHPNYLAVIVEFAALPMAAGAWASALVLSAANALIVARRIAAEERLLEEIPAYRERFSGKARFIPGIF
ncbi:MAG: isoprenylcysteine carboxylmethyltransferase family protein [Candidatus Dormibacteraceae bacterium]